MHTNATEIIVLAGSGRALRRSPAIAAWIADLGRRGSGRPHRVVEVAELGLTLDGEPCVPALGRYQHEATRRWSAQVSAAAGVVFVTPQYNWGYPAALKNAVDHLYVEWRGKPGLVVSYGGHGGDRCAAQLREVLRALKLDLTAKSPGLRLARERIEADDGKVEPAVDFGDQADEVAAALAALEGTISSAGGSPAT